MKLKAQMAEQKKFFMELKNKAKKENNKEKYVKALAVIATLDWVQGSRMGDNPIDFLIYDRF